MPKKGFWDAVPGALFAAALVLLGAAVANMNPMALILASGVGFVIALGVGIINQRRAAAHELQEKWEQSYREFRTNLTRLTAHIRSALHQMGSSVAWDDVARKARWPDLGDQPLKGWPARMAHWMTSDEQALLAVARHVEQVEQNTVPFQTARSLLSDALDQWLEWRSETAIAATVDRRVTEHREAIIMLVYLEIAHADAMMKTSPAPQWRHLAGAYSALLA